MGTVTVRILHTYTCALHHALFLGLKNPLLNPKPRCKIQGMPGDEARRLYPCTVYCTRVSAKEVVITLSWSEITQNEAITLPQCTGFQQALLCKLQREIRKRVASSRIRIQDNYRTTVLQMTEQLEPVCLHLISHWYCPWHPPPPY